MIDQNTLRTIAQQLSYSQEVNTRAFDSQAADEMRAVREEELTRMADAIARHEAEPATAENVAWLENARAWRDALTN